MQPARSGGLLRRAQSLAALLGILVLAIVIALPGVEPDQITVTLSAGVLIVSGERPLPLEVRDARIHRLEIPQGHFQRRIELPPARFEITGRHLANGCLKLELHKG